MVNTKNRVVAKFFEYDGNIVKEKQIILTKKLLYAKLVK